MATKFPMVFQNSPPPRRLATRDWDNFLPNSINLHKLTQRPATVPSGFSYLFNYNGKPVISVFTFFLLRKILAVLGFAVRIIFSVVPFILTNWWALQKLGSSSKYFKTGNEIRIQRAITRPSSFKFMRLFTKIHFLGKFHIFNSNEVKKRWFWLEGSISPKTNIFKVFLSSWVSTRVAQGTSICSALDLD